MILQLNSHPKLVTLELSDFLYCLISSVNSGIFGLLVYSLCSTTTVHLHPPYNLSLQIHRKGMVHKSCTKDRDRVAEVENNRLVTLLVALEVAVMALSRIVAGHINLW